MRLLGKYSVAFALTFVSVMFAVTTNASENDVTTKLTVEQLDLMPLAFTENQGQWDEIVKFRANAGGATMWFTADGVYYQFTRHIANDDTPGAPQLAVGSLYGKVPQQAVGHPLDHESDNAEQLVIKASFVGANPNPEIIGDNMMEYKCNYFIGNDPDEWHTDVPTYKAVVFKDVYAGIDLKYYGNGRQMEYDFIVSPGADPNQIMVQYDGAKSISVNADGELVVETDWGNVTELRPLIYQFDAHGCIPVDGQYVLFTDNTFGFDLGDRYDPTLALVIDPVLVYSTYLGGAGGESKGRIAVDSGGHTYVTSYTTSSDFPTENPYQETHQGSIWDVSLTKFTSTGSSLVYSTYLGGSDNDLVFGITVDNSGSAYLTGYTESQDFPTFNPYLDTNQGDADAFVTKVSSTGNNLDYSTYLGGGRLDIGFDIVVDSNGNTYVTGETWSGDFPTVNPYQGSHQGGLVDVFVTKLSSSGNSLVYSTYLGGGGSLERGCGIAVDEASNAYVTGWTESSDFPTQNPYQGSYQGGPYDAFLTKFSSTGSSLMYSTFLGGSGKDKGGYGIAVDVNGNAYVTGETSSTDFPTENPYQGSFQGGEFDAFVTKFSTSGNGLVFSTYLGGSSDDKGYDIAVDVNGNTYATGETASSDFPTQNPYQTNQSVSDVYVTKLSSSGSTLVYSTYLGGDHHDRGYGIAVDNDGNTYVSGETASFDYPIKNHYQTYQGSYDVFVTKLFDCVDSEGDNICDDDDNCPLHYNPNQEDGNGDGIGDSCTFAASTPVGDNINIELGETVEIIFDSVDIGGMTELTVTSDGPEPPPSSEIVPSSPRAYYNITTDAVFDGNAEVCVSYDDSWVPDEDESGLSMLHWGGSAWTDITSSLDTSQNTVCGITTSFSVFIIAHSGHICGDADASGGVDIDDVVYLINYIFAGGSAPDPLASGDADCAGGVDIDDVVYLITYIFAGGPAPCDPNNDEMPDC